MVAQRTVGQSSQPFAFMHRAPAAHVPAITSDETLVSAAVRGDLDAFNHLVRIHERQAYAVAYRLLRSPQAAEDAVQDAFLLAYRGLHTYRGGAFRSWMMRIVTNRCYDILRASNRSIASSLDDQIVESEPRWASVAPCDDPARHAAQTELGAVLENALDILPADQRLTVILCDVQGYSYDEAAQATGVAIGTVKSRLSRARAALRDELRRCPDADGYAPAAD